MTARMTQLDACRVLDRQTHTRRDTYIAPDLPPVDPTAHLWLGQLVIAWAAIIIIAGAGVIVGLLIGAHA